MWYTEVGLVAGWFVADVAFGYVVAEESDKILVEWDVGCDGVVVSGHAELCGVGDFVPLEYAFAFKSFEMS